MINRRRRAASARACARRLGGRRRETGAGGVDGAGVEKIAAELGQVAVRADVTKTGRTSARLVDEPYKRGAPDVLFKQAGVIPRCSR